MISFYVLQSCKAAFFRGLIYLEGVSSYNLKDVRGSFRLGKRPANTAGAHGSALCEVASLRMDFRRAQGCPPYKIKEM